MKKMPRVSIIILNWNGWRDTTECLESLYRINYPNYDVIVVDNGSQDDSVQKIKEYCAGKIEVNSKFFEYSPYNKPIKVFEISEDEARRGKFNKPVYEKYDANRRLLLIRNKGNYGFAGGNNVGIKFALSVLNPDYVLLLNNDTVVELNFLTELIKVAESDEKIGVVGSTIYYYDSERIQSAGEYIRRFLTTDQRLKGRKHIDDMSPARVDYVSGTSILIKSKALRSAGLFDESFFLYWEETELQARINKRGYKILNVPASKVWHKVSKSFRSSAHKTYFVVRNRIRYAQLHLPKNSRILFFLYYFLWEFWFYTVGLFAKHLILYHNADVPLAYVRGTIDGLKLRNRD